MCCKWRSPTDIYVGVYGQGVPPYLMDAIGQALNGWNGATAMGFVWEDRSDPNANIVIVPYWQNWTSAPHNPPAGADGSGGCSQLDSSGRWCVHGEVDLNMDNSTAGSWLMLNQDASKRNLQTYAIEHELGHVIGLDHSCVNVQIMTGSQSPNCPNQPYYSDSCGQYNQPACPTTPQQDDMQGVAALYPEGNSNGCAGTAPPLNPNNLAPPTPSPASTPSLLPSLPPLPSVAPIVQPPAAQVTVPMPPRPGGSIPVPLIVPTTPTPIPAPMSTDPTQYYVYQNGLGIAQQTEHDVVYPVQLGEAVAYNQAARAEGLWPSGQRVHIAAVGTDNLPVVGAADIQYDQTLPTVNRPC